MGCEEADEAGGDGIGGGGGGFAFAPGEPAEEFLQQRQDRVEERKFGKEHG